MEKCCHHFDLMRRILRSEPRRVYASGCQALNHKEAVGGNAPQPDILDNAYVMIDFENGARGMLELCMFAEASKHQEEVSLVGTHGKLEAFAPSHGAREDDGDLINFRMGVRNSAFVRGEWELTEPPAPEECGRSSLSYPFFPYVTPYFPWISPASLFCRLLEEHVAVAPELLLAGNHAGATFEELVRFTRAALAGSPTAEVSVRDGSLAVLMGVAAHRSIASGAPVLWSELLAEFESHRQ